MRRRKIKRDYSKKKYQNKLFNKRKTALRRKTRVLKIKIFLAFLFVFLIIGLFVYFLYSDHLRINSAEVSGNNEIESSQIENFIITKINESKIIPRYNYFLISKTLNEDIKNNFYFKNVKLTKKFPNKLLIEVQEKEPKFILIIDNKVNGEARENGLGHKKYLIDDQGTTMGPLENETDEKFVNLIKIVDTGDTINKEELKTSNNQIIDNKEIFFIYKIINFLDRKDLILERFEKNEFNELIAILNNNIKIFFDTKEKINNQLDKLITVVDKLEEVKEYIDVRFSDRVFYK
jgi:cell division protein FtsQ